MEFNKLVFAGLSVGCLAAAAGGSYLAVRQNQSASALVESSEPGRDAGAVDQKTPSAVTESEGVIAPEASKPEAAPPMAPVCAGTPCAVRLLLRRTRLAPRGSSNVRRAQRAPRALRLALRLATVSPPGCLPVAQGRSARQTPCALLRTAGTMWETRPSVQPSVPEYREPEPPAPPPPPAPEFVDLTVPSDAVLGLQIERTVSSELARVEDKVDARVTRDVRVADRIAIPAGSTVRGSVSEVDRGGRMKGKARLAIRFHTIVLADGTQLALKTDPVVREGQSPGGESAAKVGGAAIGGAILGAILGGGKGAAIGGAVGAGAGTAAAMTNDRNAATLAAGTTVTVRMQAPVTVTVQKE